jgi:hypothetical protein
MSELPVQYELAIDLAVLDHLGLKLYSNVPAVLTEIVANAWDADAHRVDITIDIDRKVIRVQDDGHGMNRSQLQDRFLTVGYRRRDEEETKTSPDGRPVMGRKGLGKLAPFSLAGKVDVLSSRDGERCGVSMDSKDIQEASKNGKKYSPQSLDDSSDVPEKGTLIVLRELNVERVRRPNLKERLARRFSILGTDEFRVFINGEELTDKDRGDLDKLQYLWRVGDWKGPDWLKADELRVSALPNRLDGWNPEWKINGWLGTSRKPKDLANAAGNLNVIVILARGRLFLENILDRINDGRHYTKYLTGCIEADFLDLTDLEDIATSDRQRIIEDDPRFQALDAYLRSVLNALEKEWSQWRAIDDPRVVESEFPKVSEWIESLSSEKMKRHARNVIGRVERLEIEDKSQKIELLRHTILGFKRLMIKDMAEEFSEAIEGGVDQLLRIFADLDSVEASAYRDIVKGRLDVIRAFQGLVDENAKEGVLQKYIFNKLWLIDPSMERATGSELIEQRLHTQYKIFHKDLDDTTSKGRVDIKYRTVLGKHIIVELKRALRKVSLLELAEQGKQYVSDLQELLVKTETIKAGQKADIEVRFIVGEPLDEELNDPEGCKHVMNFISPGSRIHHYDALINGALQSYGEYLEATKDIDALDDLLKSIEHRATEQQIVENRVEEAEASYAALVAPDPAPSEGARERLLARLDELKARRG